MTTHFSNITKGYNGKKPQNPDDIDKALKYARYIDVIKILKEKKDYKVDGEFMKDAINDYIQDGTKGALDFIKSRNENNKYIDELKKKKKEEEKRKKENGRKEKRKEEEDRGLLKHMQEVCKTNKIIILNN
jgi:DNA-binding NtrC family response regulator